MENQKSALDPLAVIQSSELPDDVKSVLSGYIGCMSDEIKARTQQKQREEAAARAEKELDEAQRITKAITATRKYCSRTNVFASQDAMTKFGRAFMKTMYPDISSNYFTGTNVDIYRELDRGTKLLVRTHMQKPSALMREATPVAVAYRDRELASALDTCDGMMKVIKAISKSIGIERDELTSMSDRLKNK